MRFVSLIKWIIAWSFLLLIMLVAALAQGPPPSSKINPHTQIRWPASCNSSNFMSYNFLSNTCFNVAVQITAGTTATLPPGSQATVTQSGTYPNFVLNFGIPVGFPGTVSGVYDLVAQFGASGSNQTMNCTATSGNSTLTGCTGGDFKVGQAVVIPQAGIQPTAIAPTGLTTTCGVHNGGSCAGSVVYCYQIVTIQNTPNGSVSAPTAPVCITQAAQLPFSNYSTTPDVYTTVSWTAASGGTLYAVYKSINGGPSNFYYILPSNVVSFPDYGDMAPSIMNCVDVMIPCTAPTGTTPNDVYAVISDISGNSVTLASRSQQPAYGATVPYPSQPSVSGSVTVQHDDTPAFQAMHDTLQGATGPNGGSIKVHIPAGWYNVHSETTHPGWAKAININGLRNVVIEGDGDSTFIYQPNDRGANTGRTIFANCGDPDNSIACTGFNYGFNFGNNSIGRYPLNGTINAGINHVTLSNPADAANFPPGTFITLFNSATSGVYPLYMYMEINRITAADAATGLVTLAYPTTKQYGPVGTQDPFTECGQGCFFPAAMSPIVGGVSAHRVTIRKMRFRALAYGFLQLGHADYVTFEDNTGVVSTFETAGTNRHVTIRNNNIIEDGYTASQGLGVTSAGDADWSITNNIFQGMYNGQTCSEHAANIHVDNNDITYTGTRVTLGSTGVLLGNTSAVLMMTGCVNSTFNNNRLKIMNSNMSWMLRSDLSVGGNEFANNSIYIDALPNGVGTTTPSVATMTVGIGTHSQGVGMFNNKITIGNLTAGTFQGANAPIVSKGATWAALNTLALPAVSGNFNITHHYGQFTVLELDLNANLSSLVMADFNILPRHYFALEFVQPGNWSSTQTYGLGQVAIDGGAYYRSLVTGNTNQQPSATPAAWATTTAGPYAIPGGCTNAQWNTPNGNGIDCPNGVPALAGAPGSHLLIWFYVDGEKNVHVEHSNSQTVGQYSVNYVTRTVPIVVGDEVDIGNFSMGNNTANQSTLRIDLILQTQTGKQYMIPVNFNSTNNVWQKVVPDTTNCPSSSTGCTGQDADLEIKVQNRVYSLRLRRTQGTAALTAYMTVQQFGINIPDLFTPSTATSTVTAPTNIYTFGLSTASLKDWITGPPCTMTAGTCGPQSFGRTLSAAPACFSSWTGAGTLTTPIKIASTTTTVTPSSATATDTAVVNWVCIGK